MKAFLEQLRWQFLLLEKSSIISISIGVTVIYAAILYYLRDMESIDQFLVAFVLNDPSVIGYFFIALGFYTEKKHHLLTSLYITPAGKHIHLAAKVLALSVLGVICSLGLAFSVKLTGLHWLEFTLGSFGICILSILLGIIMVRYSPEILKFTMLSVPVFILFINLPLLQYLGAIELGPFKYLLPIQGSLEMIAYGVSGRPYDPFYALPSIFLLIPFFYFLAFRIYYQETIKSSLT